MTITEAIKKVMFENGAPMTVDEAYQAIVTAKLYEFHADNPLQIVRGQIRRHCEGLDFPSAVPTKHFKIIGENKYWILKQPIRSANKTRRKRKEKQDSQYQTKHQSSNSLREMQVLYARYIACQRQSKIDPRYRKIGN